MPILPKSLYFCLLLLFFYFLGCLIIPYSFLNRRAIGDVGGSLAKFSEIEKYHDIDVLFAGSSHCVYGLDTSIFENQGLTAFNMGTTLQTPINAYFLLKRHLDKLNPKVFVYEVYTKSFELEGLESYLDLVANHKISFEFFEMAFILKKVLAWNALIAKVLKENLLSSSGHEQQLGRGEKYTKGGYISSSLTSNENISKDLHRSSFNKTQLKYFKKILKLLESKDIKVVLVTIPLPEIMLKSIENYTEVIQFYNNMSNNDNVLFVDFHELAIFNYPNDYKDASHLNKLGASKYSKALLDCLFLKQGRCSRL